MGCLLGGTLLSLGTPAPCAAEVHTLRVVEDGRRLREALETSLASWGVRVTAAADASLPDAEVVVTRCGEELCLTLHVEAPPLAQSWAVHAPELDAEAAAAIALGIKARLRNGAALPLAPNPAASEPAAPPAPQPDNVSAPPQPEASPPPLAPSAPPSPAHTSAPRSPGVDAPRPRPVLAALRVALGAGLLSTTLGGGGPLPRVEGRLGILPWQRGPFALGASLGAAGHVPITLRASGVRASFGVSELTAGVRGQYALGARFAVDVGAHVGVLFTRIVGERESTDERFDRARRGALLAGTVGLPIAMSRHWALVPLLTLHARPRTQRYLVADAPVWELTRAAVSATLELEARR